MSPGTVAVPARDSRSSLTEQDRAYHLRRAAAEAQLEREATCAQVRGLHGELARLHLERLAGHPARLSGAVAPPRTSVG